ncbi:putative DNA repair protein [Talaromyces proteolyticus]|uniref:DNA repair protein n=1 Tax=Talaromyces proteolyticus TaxID=1131652 RepID=A0AAD4KVB3_9EURO|nr:putative DNA repair protein [Talaromyces proteolyticus]KAH8697536.1 putative DNA repair protein [Talaromyces proteolyticus]
MKWTHPPSKSGVHRFACLSLYRALLRQSSKLPQTNVEAESIRQLVRSRFDRYKELCSPTKTIHSLQAGYEALDLFYSAARGSKDSLTQINQYLQKLEARKLVLESKKHEKLSKDVGLVTLGRHQKRRAQNIEYARQTKLPHPNVEPILSRPRPIITGRRRVPVFVCARGIPFLRIKKPQPESLSRVIRQKLAQRDKLTGRRARLYADLLFASDEENWDRYLQDRDPVLWKKYDKQPTWIKGTWAQDVWRAYEKSVNDNRNYEQRHQDTAEAMWKVVLAERELAEKEEAQRKAQVVESNPDPILSNQKH